MTATINTSTTTNALINVYLEPSSTRRPAMIPNVQKEPLKKLVYTRVLSIVVRFSMSAIENVSQPVPQISTLIKAAGNALSHVLTTCLSIH